MAAAGLYRIAVPRSLGGAQAHPIEQIRLIEAVSEIHGSTGWNLMIGIENMGILGAVYPRAVTEKLYADPQLIISGSLNPLGHGGPCAWWLSHQRSMAVRERHSQRRLLLESEHRPRRRTVVCAMSRVCCCVNRWCRAPRSRSSIPGRWPGLQGSGSHDVRHPGSVRCR